MSTESKHKHIGFKISRIRELRGIKQEALAIAMNVTQQTISNLENSETIKDKKLDEVAKALGVTTDIIKNFSDEMVLNIILNSFTNDDTLTNTINPQPNFNLLDKIAELYERLIKAEKSLAQAEKDKVAYLERLLNK